MKPSRAAFAAIFAALGVVGFVRGVLVPVWAPVPAATPGHEVLAYACAAASLASGVGLVWRRTAAVAARVLFAALALWWLAFRVRAIAAAPATFPPWDGAAETAAIVAAAWTLAAVPDVRVARRLYGLALVAFGLAHFIYPAETASLVPGWLPARAVCAYATGVAFVAAGAAVLAGVWARLATALSAAQIALFTAIVWIPIVAAGSANAFQWSELAISAALAAAGWVIADSYSAAA